MTGKPNIRKLKTEVPGLDDLTGGGLPEYSFNLIAGAPGAGKTTLAHQIMFRLASEARRAVFFTVLGEPPIKLLRYQQQYTFFDAGKVGDVIRYVNLADELQNGGFDAVLSRIIKEVTESEAGLVFVDSFGSITVSSRGQAGTGIADLQQFVQALGLHMTSWQATTFLIGEYALIEGDANPVFTIADGILWLTQTTERNSIVRKMQATKMRGQAPLPGWHAYTIDEDGIQVFPRRVPKTAARAPMDAHQLERLSLGVPRLDELMGGGLPRGYTLLVAGPTGSGKSTLAAAFLAEGARHGEPGLFVAFDANPSRFRNAALDDAVAAGHITVFDHRYLDLSSDELVDRVGRCARKIGARRIVVDSVTGLELALAPSFREDFRESLFRMISGLMEFDAAVLLTCDLEDRYGELRFSPYGAAFLTDAVLIQRYIEIEGALRRVLAVVKVRNCNHSAELHQYDIDATGIVIGASMQNYEGLLGGRPHAVEKQS